MGGLRLILADHLLGTSKKAYMKALYWTNRGPVVLSILLYAEYSELPRMSCAGSPVSEKTSSRHLVNRGSSAPALLLSDVGRILLPEVAAPRTLKRKTIQRA